MVTRHIKYLMFCVYHSPSPRDTDFIDYLGIIIENYFCKERILCLLVILTLMYQTPRYILKNKENYLQE